MYSIIKTVRDEMAKETQAVQSGAKKINRNPKTMSKKK